MMESHVTSSAKHEKIKLAHPNFVINKGISDMHHANLPYLLSYYSMS